MAVWIDISVVQWKTLDSEPDLDSDFHSITNSIVVTDKSLLHLSESLYALIYPTEMITSQGRWGNVFSSYLF